MTLMNKKAIVTGSARGIGRGCAIELARAGADVIVNDRERTASAEAVVAEIQGLGRQAALVEGDAFESDSCETIVQRAVEAFGRIDILVSNPAYTRARISSTTTRRRLRGWCEGRSLAGFT